MYTICTILRWHKEHGKTLACILLNNSYGTKYFACDKTQKKHPAEKKQIVLTPLQINHCKKPQLWFKHILLTFGMYVGYSRERNTEMN